MKNRSGFHAKFLSPHWFISESPTITLEMRATRFGSDPRGARSATTSSPPKRRLSATQCGAEFTPLVPPPSHD